RAYGSTGESHLQFEEPNGFGGARPDNNKGFANAAVRTNYQIGGDHADGDNKVAAASQLQKTGCGVFPPAGNANRGENFIRLPPGLAIALNKVGKRDSAHAFLRGQG